MIHPRRPVDKDVGVSCFGAFCFQVGASLGRTEPAIGNGAHTVIQLGIFQLYAVEHPNLLIVLLVALLLARVFGYHCQCHGMRGHIPGLTPARLGLGGLPFLGLATSCRRTQKITERTARASSDPLLGPPIPAGLLRHHEISAEPGHHLRPLRLLTRAILFVLRAALASLTFLSCSAPAMTDRASGFTAWA